jgi:aryl-alcohol dehydrogenase-like predicted oxidoreductase
MGGVLTTGLISQVSCASRSAASGAQQAIPRRSFGRTGVRVSILGLGGWHVGTQKDPADSLRIIQSAIDRGINFLDNSIDYNDGQSEIRMGHAIQGRRDQVFVMTKHNFRDKKSALRDLEISLKRLRTDYLDLWQFHSIERPEDPDWIFSPNGACDAALLAKQQGKARFIGFTGHKNPDYHLQMLAKPFAWDAIQMPLNVLDHHFQSFEKKVLPVAVSRRLGIIGMKPLAFGNALKTGRVTAPECLRYAMSLPVSVTITGCETLERLDQAIGVAAGFRGLKMADRDALALQVQPSVEAGQLEPYKITKDFDNNPAAFPPPYEA